MDSEIPNVIYETPQKTGPKNAVFDPVLCASLAPEPLHIVVDTPYLPLEPQYVTLLRTPHVLGEE